MKLDRSKTRFKHLKDPDDNYMDATPAERIGCMYELTKQAWALKDPEIAEQR